MRSSPERARGRSRTSFFSAVIDGWRRVLRAPVLTLSMLGLTFILALPLSIALRGMLEEHLGSSLDAGKAIDDWNAGWAAAFGAQAQGLGRTFTHEIIGFGGTLANVSRFVDREALNPTVTGAVVAYVAAWVFLSGGLLDRLARARPIRTAAFFSACGVYFWRFLRLAVVAGAVYWALFRWLHPWLFGTLYDRFTRSMTEERDAMVLRGSLYAVFLGALMLVSIVTDFAKVRTVVEDRRSMLGAVAASLRFVRRRFGRVLGLYLVNVAIFAFIIGLWRMAAPGASVSPAWAFLLAQMYLLMRMWAKLAFMASEVVFFQAELAHAEYTALPEPVWPDSPAVEAIKNLTIHRQ